jgi:GTP-binding protein
MDGFIDETRLELASGTGGSGAVSFRREKYVAEGGPDGGDGGTGGNVVFLVKHNLKTFMHLRSRHKFVAENGRPGSGARKTGHKGQDVVIAVPPGTRLLDYRTKRLIVDFQDQTEPYILLKGGRGGRGNWHFRSSQHQAPKHATKGMSGANLEVLLELALIADVGLVGFPNAGKSSLLNVLSNAQAKVGDYPFTTRKPQLGMLRQGDRELVVADIPGILAGASEGVGLGLQFLKHISRTHGLAFLIDLSQPIDHVFDTLLHEVSQYHAPLLEKPRLIIGTKLDLPQATENFAQLQLMYPKETITAISSHHHTNLIELIQKLFDLKYHEEAM